MGTVYGLIGILFALVLALLILVLKYRSDVAFIMDMQKINNEYVKECKENWNDAIRLCRDIYGTNENLRELVYKEN